MNSTAVLYDKIWYLPTSLVSRDGSVTLIVHHYQIRRGKGVYLRNKLDAIDFSNEKEMADTITRKRFRALPEEAEGQPQYIAKRVLSLMRKYQAQS